MKKKDFLFITILTILSIGLIRCSNKNEDTLTDMQKYDEYGTIFDKSYMTFKTTDDYINFISDLTSEKLEYVKEKNVNPLSLVLKSSNDNKKNLYEPELLILLSADKTIKIGKWIIKVDLPNNVILALNNSDIEYYDDLIHGKSNDKIYSFSPEESVLDILENEDLDNFRFKGMSGLFCNERRANADDEEEDVGDTWRYGKVRYYSAGVYFSLYGILTDHQTIYVGSQKTDFTIEIEFRFDDRCDRSYEQLTWATDDDSWSFPAAGSSHKLKAYESTKALKNYDLKGVFTVDLYNMYGTLDGTYTSNELSISDY